MKININYVFIEGNYVISGKYKKFAQKIMEK